MNNYEKAVKNIREKLKEYVKQYKLQSLVLGVSGGIDSCLCAALAKPICNELNIPLIGRSLPMKSNKWEEIERAQLTGKVFCSNFKEENLNDIFLPLSAKLNPIFTDGVRHKINLGNIKARLRMIYLYDIAYKMNGMVLSTDNYTEYLLGFWTLHGDVGDFGMIQQLWKTEVYDMAEWLINNELQFLDKQETLKSCIDALATDGLGVSSLGDLGQIMPDWKGNSRDGYKEVDRILSKFLESQEYDLPTPLDEKNPVIQRHLRSQFKRNNPINIKRNLIFE